MLNIQNLLESITKLEFSIQDTEKFKKKLELDRSNLKQNIVLLESTARVHRANQTIPILHEYKKTLNSIKIAKLQFSQYGVQILQIERSLIELNKTLQTQKTLLSRLEALSQPRIIPFKTVK